MPKNKEIEEMILIISSIDALSCGRGKSLDFLDEITWKHGFEDWKNVKKDLNRMINIPLLTNKRIRLYSSAFSISNFFYSSFLVFLFLAVIVNLSGIHTFSERFVSFFYFIAVLTFIFIVVRYFSKSRMDAFFKMNRAQQKQRDENIHVFVQSVIDALKKKMEETGEEKSNYRIRLYRTDYQNLRIVAEPGLLRDCYFATVT
jgi:hypothetical protein